jgi:hypothetical protein
MAAPQTAPQAEFQDGGRPVAPPFYPVGGDGFSTGGTFATPIAASVTTTTIIKSTAGRLCRILVTTSGANALTVYDGDGPSGTIIGIVPANAAVGTLIECQAPATQGITVAGSATNPAVTVIWS